MSIQAQEPIELSDNPGTYFSILPGAEVLDDPNNSLDITQVTQASADKLFKPLTPNTQNTSRDVDNYWLRFKLHNTTTQSQRYWLSIRGLTVKKAELFTQSSDPALTATYQLIDQTGNNYINPNWITQENFNFLRINLAAGETRLFYMRLDIPSDILLTPHLYTDHEHTVLLSAHNNQQGMFYGILFALFIYTLNIYITLKDRTFFLFILVLISGAFQYTVYQGGLKTLISEWTELIGPLIIAAMLIHRITMALFIREFLHLPRHHPKLDQFIIATVWLVVIILPLKFFSIVSNLQTMLIIGFLCSLIIMGVSAIRLKQGFSPAIYSLIGGAFSLLGVALFVLTPHHLRFDLFASKIFSLSIALQMIAWALGLGSRIEVLNKLLNQEVHDRKLREIQLTQSQRIAKYGDWSWDTHNNNFHLSKSARDIIPTFTGDQLDDFFQQLHFGSPDERIALKNIFTHAAELKQGFETEFSIIQSNNSTQYYLMQADYLLKEDGTKTSKLIGTIHNITDSKLADIAYRENEQRWRDLADSSFEAILIYQNGEIIDANVACSHVLGCEPKQLIGNSGEVFLNQKTLPDLLAEISAAENKAIELTIPRKDQTERTVELRSKHGEFNQQPANIVAIRDISERKQYEQQLRQLGYYDSLTGLANRSLFQQRLQHAIDKSERSNEKLALLFIDLDQFKKVNDSLGHDVGDQLLIEVSLRLKQRSRKTDTVARLGGDEFAILTEDIAAPYAAAKLADELLAIMSNIIEIDGYPLLVTPSIGIAMYPADGTNTGELLRKADTAMYDAKSKGRNNYQFYTVELNDKIVRRMELESELRHANENGEFFLYFQPKVSLTTGKLVGAEALLRWNSRKHGIVSPAEFIPIAEDTGMIHQIGEFVLNNACEQASTWIKLHPAFRSIAVNISGIQFNHGNLVNTVANILKATQIPPQSIDLEITENAIINNAEDAIHTMTKLKELGVKLSLDDFGTGYSSLSYLKRFPVDSLKIDRSFVAEISSNKTDLKIAENIVKLAHDLSLNVVAEGVETPEQLSLIKSIGCDEIQGYIFSKPVDSDEIKNMLSGNINLYDKENTINR